MTETWTAIATCSVCKEELNRATGVPTNEKPRIIMTAPLVAVCDKPHHSSFSDCNIGVELEWIKE